MKKAFEITDKKIIDDILHEAQFGTLALCANNKPYSLPINFVELNGEIFFHGAKKGKKISIIKENTNASFSVVEDCSLIPSILVQIKVMLVLQLTFFKSIIIDGKIEFVENYNEKANILESLMQKLQKEGKYIPLNDEMYKKAINATCLFKLIPNEIRAKFKLGQHLKKDRFERICVHLQERGTKKDLETLKLMKQFYK